MCAVDVVMVQAKRIYILIIKVNKLFSFFSSWCFLKEIENMYSVFLSSYTNTRESLNLKKVWKHSPAARVPTAFLVLPNFHSCLYNSIETRYMSVYHNVGQIRESSSKSIPQVFTLVRFFNSKTYSFSKNSYKTLLSGKSTILSTHTRRSLS